MKALLLVLLIAFTCPSAWTAGASDPCQGPETNIDLESNMPPIYDQESAPWCATFSAKTLLEYNIHIACQGQHPFDLSSCAYTPSTLLSATDLQSDSSGESPDTRGKYIDLSSDGTSISDVLEGAQKDGALNDSELPLDQALFSGSGTDGALIERLSDYYDQLPASGNLATASNCSHADDPFQDLRARFPLIQQIAEKAIASNGGKNEAAQAALVTGLEKAYAPISDSLRKQRQAVVPAYNIEDFSSADPNAFKSHVVETLRKNQPAALPICLNQLMQDVHLSDVADPSDPCGAHEMVAVGFRKTAAGQCEVHLRNTWGDRWPQSGNGHGDGTLWVDMNTLVQSMDSDSTQASKLYDVTSISPRPPGSPIRNVAIRDNFDLVGETWDGKLVGTAERHFRNQQGQTITERGTFAADSTLAQGTRIAPDGAQVWGRFKGAAPMPVCGAMKLPGQGIYCVLHGVAEGDPVPSPLKCSCVH